MTREEDRIFDASEMREDLIGLREDGTKRGCWTGFKSLFEHYSMKLGSFSIIYAAPRQGKSEFIKELVLNSAEFEGWKWAVFTPESGSPREVYADYATGYLRKSFVVDPDRVSATHSEAERAITWMSEHIFVIDPGLDDMTIKDIYASVEALEKKKKIKIDGVIIDPYTEIAEADPHAPIHMNVKNDLNSIRKYSSHGRYHTIVSVHTRDLPPVPHKVKGDPKVYRIPPEPEIGELSGGQNWSRKGFMILNVYRTPWWSPVLDDQGNYYEKWQTKINIKKVKPKSAGKEGYVYLYYDMASGRYYEKDGYGKQFSYPNPDAEEQITLDL